MGFGGDGDGGRGRGGARDGDSVASEIERGWLSNHYGVELGNIKRSKQLLRRLSRKGT